MPLAKPVFFSEDGQLSSILNSLGDNSIGFRQNESQQWDTLIVPNLLNDDTGKTLHIKGNDNLGEYNYITLSANDNQYRTIDIEVHKNNNIAILYCNSRFIIIMNAGWF